MKTKKHITEEELIDLAFENLNISNPNVDKLLELGERMDLIIDQENQMFLNPKWKTPEEFLTEKYKHCENHENGIFGFHEVISIIEEYSRDYE